MAPAATAAAEEQRSRARSPRRSRRRSTRSWRRGSRRATGSRRARSRPRGSTRRRVAPVDATSWSELGPYAYFPDDRRYLVAPFSNSGSGSGYNTGRITGIAVAPDGTVYAGGAGGGVWKSTDAAHQQWTPLFDGQSTRWRSARSTVVPKRAASGYTVYAGTGEPTINLDSYAGVGVLASTDAGASWKRVGGSELQGAGIFKIVATPDGRTLFAATSNGLYRRSGIDRRLEAQVVGDAGLGRGAERPGAQPDVRRGRPARHGRQGDRRGARLAGRRGHERPLRLPQRRRQLRGPAAPPQGYVPAKSQGRASIAYSADGKTLYAMVQDASTFNSGAGQTILAGIYSSKRDVDGPFNQIASAGKLQASGSAQNPGKIGREYKPGVQAWYNQFLVVDPRDPKHLYAGLEEVYETKDGGSNWVAGGAVLEPLAEVLRRHAGRLRRMPEHDALRPARGDRRGWHLWVGNDGGVFSRPTSQSTAGGGWTDHNRNLGTLQYYYADSGRDPVRAHGALGRPAGQRHLEADRGRGPLQPAGGRASRSAATAAATRRQATPTRIGVLTEYTNLDAGRHARRRAQLDRRDARRSAGRCSSRRSSPTA